MAAEQAPGASSYTGMPRRQPRLRQPHTPAPARSPGTMKRPAACAAPDHAAPDHAPSSASQDHGSPKRPQKRLPMPLPIGVKSETTSVSSDDGSDDECFPYLLEEMARNGYCSGGSSPTLALGEGYCSSQDSSGPARAARAARAARQDQKVQRDQKDQKDLEEQARGAEAPGRGTASEDAAREESPRPAEGSKESGSAAPSPDLETLVYDSPDLENMRYDSEADQWLPRSPRRRQRLLVVSKAEKRGITRYGSKKTLSAYDAKKIRSKVRMSFAHYARK